MALARAYALIGDWERVDAFFQGKEASSSEIVPRVRFLIWRRDSAGLMALIEGIEARGEPAGPPMKMLQRVVNGEPLPRFWMDPSAAGDGDTRRRTFLLQLDAEAAAFVGDNERAIQGLQENAESGLFDVAWVDGCPLFDGLRADPRFAKLRALVAQRAEEIVAAYQAP
jgi:hypothetical protein